MSAGNGCACGQAPSLVFACSGAADVGVVSDLAARRISAGGRAKMLCLAGVGGRVSGILKSTEAAAAILAIDGCALDCARRTLEEAGFSGFAHLSLGEIGMAKGETPPSEPNVARVAEEALRRLDQRGPGSCGGCCGA